MYCLSQVDSMRVIVADHLHLVHDVRKSDFRSGVSETDRTPAAAVPKPSASAAGVACVAAAPSTKLASGIWA